LLSKERKKSKNIEEKAKKKEIKKKKLNIYSRIYTSRKKLNKI
jgi:hypothetical protein